MDIETKIDLAKRKPTEEVVTEADLREIFQNYAHPRHYIGFEISGMVHIGSGLCTMLKIRDFLAAGCKSTIWLADYHAWINGKFGGDLDKIQKIGEGYFKHAFISLGLAEDKVDYLLASKTYEKHPEFWADTLRITKDTTMNRMLRCVTIMGRKENENLNAASMVYPAMQAADIFLLDVQIAHAGMDQRKVHMLAHELAPKFKKKICAIHGHLLPGLQGPGRMNAPGVETGPTDAKVDQEIEVKMSKSKPDSAIFVHDGVDDIKRKINKAYCPEKIVDGNPIIEYAEYLVLRDKSLKIERPAKFGGDIEIVDSNQLRNIYVEGKLHPMDLKAAVTRELSDILKPSREYFDKHKEYLAQLNVTDITR
ncbi:Tyrosine--tRNA ligase [Candidatus Bilamarchaeum dharawalense]|uniref:tyrosine--tRNA ligase n=1 Tax=Candidatus Bilamarchaeum dharawalense TaxID=2885759 RepID=A0A5E4LRX9_9ARCH|nr:Tyrosine--tRNA ligase [Candidatus Bilamarchaeum dharawalense]